VSNSVSTATTWCWKPQRHHRPKSSTCCRRHKPGIVALLRPSRDGWSAEDWQAFFDERAGSAEFDSGLPRPQAEVRAFAYCVVEWLNRNFVRSPTGRCLTCGGGDHRTMRCFPTASSRPAMPGCIRAAGPHGTPGARPRLSPRWRLWESTNRGPINDRKEDSRDQAIDSGCQRSRRSEGNAEEYRRLALRSVEHMLANLTGRRPRDKEKANTNGK
jgi:hypothetical protein